MSQSKQIQSLQTDPSGFIGIDVSKTTLAGAGLPVAIVNPRQVRDFAKATGRLAKTDRLDAVVLAQFAEVIHPEPRPLPDALAQQFSVLVECRRKARGDGDGGAQPLAGDAQSRGPPAHPGPSGAAHQRATQA